MKSNAYYKEEHEIEIRTLLWKLVLSWKAVLIVACIFAILGYGYAKYKQHSQKQTTVVSTKTAEETVEADEIIDFEGSIDNAREAVLRYQKALNNEYNYMQESIMMQLDPYHVWSVTQEFELSAVGKVDINELMMKGRMLTGAALSAESVARIAEKYDKDPQYIRELIGSGARDNQYEMGGVQIHNGLSDTDATPVLDEEENKFFFYVSAKSNDLDFTVEIVEMLTEYMLEKTAEIAPSPYVVTKLPMFNYEQIDYTVISTQNDSRVRAYDYSDRIVKLNTILDNMGKAQETSLVEEKEAEGEKRVSGKKMAVLGFGGGLVLAILFLVLKNILSSKFQTENDFRSWFTLNNLGTAPVTDKKRKARGPRRRILKRLEGSSMRLTQDEFYKMAATNVVNAAADKNTILITGSVVAADMQQLAGKLLPILKEKCENLKVVFAENLLDNPETRANLQTADGVVLVEKRNYSNVEDVKEEIEVVSSLNKEIMGAILL